MSGVRELAVDSVFPLLDYHDPNAIHNPTFTILTIRVISENYRRIILFF